MLCGVDVMMLGSQVPLGEFVAWREHSIACRIIHNVTQQSTKALNAETLVQCDACCLHCVWVPTLHACAVKPCVYAMQCVCVPLLCLLTALLVPQVSELGVSACEPTFVFCSYSVGSLVCVWLLQRQHSAALLCELTQHNWRPT